MEKYTITLWWDKEYYVYKMIGGYNNVMFKGTIVEVHAWISLQEKGYEL